MVPAQITSCTGSVGKPVQTISYADATSTSTFSQLAPSTAPFWTAGVFAFLLAAGTGGLVSTASTSAVAEIDSARTGSVCRFVCVSKSRRDDEEEGIEGSTQVLSVLQHYLSLNLSELAMVLQVSRPTIYSWLRDQSSPQAQNVARIRQILKLAKIWPGISRRPVGLHLKTPVMDGRSVLDLLSQDRIDPELVRTALASCAVLVEREARQGPRTAAEVAKQYGLRSQSRGSKEESVAQETGL